MCGLSFGATDATGRPARYRGSGARAELRHQQRRAADDRASTSSTTTPRAARSTAALASRRRPACTTTTSMRRCASATLWTGTDAFALRVQSRGQGDVCASGNLRGKPAIIVHGRADTLIPVSFTSRPYYGLNKRSRAPQSKLTLHRGDQRAALRRLHRQRGVPGLRLGVHPAALLLHQGDGRRVREPDVERAAAAVAGRAHDPARRHAGGGPADHAANVPPIAATPSAANAITFSGNTLTIPD